MSNSISINSNDNKYDTIALNIVIVSLIVLAFSWMMSTRIVHELSGNLVDDGVLVQRGDSTTTLVIPDKR